MKLEIASAIPASNDENISRQCRRVTATTYIKFLVRAKLESVMVLVHKFVSPFFCESVTEIWPRRWECLIRVCGGRHNDMSAWHGWHLITGVEGQLICNDVSTYATRSAAVLCRLCAPDLSRSPYRQIRDLETFVAAAHGVWCQIKFLLGIGFLWFHIHVDTCRQHNIYDDYNFVVVVVVSLIVVTCVHKIFLITFSIGLYIRKTPGPLRI